MPTPDVVRPRVCVHSILVTGAVRMCIAAAIRLLFRGGKCRTRSISRGITPRRDRVCAYSRSRAPAVRWISDFRRSFIAVWRFFLARGILDWARGREDLSGAPWLHARVRCSVGASGVHGESVSDKIWKIEIMARVWISLVLHAVTLQHWGINTKHDWILVKWLHCEYANCYNSYFTGKVFDRGCLSIAYPTYWTIRYKNNFEFCVFMHGIK